MNSASRTSFKDAFLRADVSLESERPLMTNRFRLEHLHHVLDVVISPAIRVSYRTHQGFGANSPKRTSLHTSSKIRFKLLINIVAVQIVRLQS